MFPAIDLRGGLVVRLRQGEFSREQVYSDDPVAVARSFAEAGAKWIHVVDLDGARGGEARQAGAVASIVGAVRGGSGPTRVQAAGGLRTAAAIDAAIHAGVERVVVGTAALGDPALVRDAIGRHGGGRVAVALDVRDGRAVGEGWVPGATSRVLDESLDELSAVGVETFAVTAIARDGLLDGPDLELLDRCVRSTDADILASGGIRSIADVTAVQAIGCRGAIVGRAIYDGQFDLAMALAELSIGA